MLINIIIQGLNILFAVVGLILVLRLVLHIFNVSPQKPVMRLLTLITDPVLDLVCKILGIPAYRRYDISTIGKLAAALIVIWVGRTLAVWGLQFIRYLPGWVSDPLRSLYAMVVFILRLAFELYSLALLMRVLFEWVRIPYSSRVMRFLWDITEPVLAPLRRVLPPFGGLDFSPLIAFFLLNLLEQLVFTMLGWLA